METAVPPSWRWHAVRLGCCPANESSERKSKLNVKLKPVSDTKLKYKGKVVAPSEECRENRTVSFKADGKRLAKTTTDERGKFSVEGKRPESGTEIVAKLKPAGDDCPKLTATGAAP